MLFQVIETKVCPMCYSPHIGTPVYEVAGVLKPGTRGNYELSKYTEWLDFYYRCFACENDFEDPEDALLVLYGSQPYVLVLNEDTTTPYLLLARVPYEKTEQGGILLHQDRPAVILYLSPVDTVTRALFHKVHDDNPKLAKQAFRNLLSLVGDFF